MKWLASWVEETDDLEYPYEKHEEWLGSWLEVIGKFNYWMALSSSVLKGTVIRYYDKDIKFDNDEAPCLIYDIVNHNSDDYALIDSILKGD